MWNPIFSSGSPSVGRSGNSWRRSEKLLQAVQSAPAQPTAEWVARQMRQLHEVLSSGTPAAAHALRELVGGSIVVEEVRVAGRKRSRLRGKCRVQVGTVISAEQVGDQLTPAAVDAGEVIVIDFVPVNPLDAKAEEAKALWDKDKLGKDIAAEMGCSRTR